MCYPVTPRVLMVEIPPFSIHKSDTYQPKCVVGFEPTNGSFADYCVKPLHHTHKTYRGKDNSVGTYFKGGLAIKARKCSTPQSPMEGGNLQNLVYHTEVNLSSVNSPMRIASASSSFLTL